MARPLKNGLDYFPFDVDFFSDEKIAAISGEFGIKGEITAIKLLCAIYRNGYYIEWNDMLKMKLLKDLPGITEQLLDSIVSRLVRWGFFDGALFDSTSILTSEGIQRRYFAIAKRRRNTEYPYVVLQGFGCPDGTSRHPDPDRPSFAERTGTVRDEAEEMVSACNNGVSACNNPSETGLLSTKTPQIKEKEIKEEVKKENRIKEKKGGVVGKVGKVTEAKGKVRRDALPAGYRQGVHGGGAAGDFKPVADLVAVLKQSPSWLESVCRRFEVGQEEVLSVLDAFPEHVNSYHGCDYRTSLYECRKYFCNYLLKCKEHNGNSEQDTRRKEGEENRGALDPYAEHRRRYGL